MTAPKPASDAVFPEKEFQQAAIKLIGKQAEFGQNGERIDPKSEPNTGWSYSPQRMKDCRKGAMWGVAYEREKSREILVALEECANSWGDYSPRGKARDSLSQARAIIARYKGTT